MPEEQAARSELATLAAIGRAIVEAQLNQDQLCELVYQLAGQIAPTDNFQMGLFDGDRYHIKVWVKDGQRLAPSMYLVPQGQGIIGWLRMSREPLLVHDFLAEADSLPAHPSYQNDQPPRSAIFLPLVVGDAVIGAMSIQSDQPNAFTDEDLRLLSVLANQSASALNNAQLYTRGQRRLNDLMAVAEVGRKINSILDLDDLLTQVVQMIGSRFSFYHVQIFLVERGSDRAYFKASSGYGLNEKWRREARSQRIGQEGIIGWVAQHGEPLLANDVSLEPRYIPDDPRLLPDTRAELAVPLVVEDGVVGVLDVQSTELNAFGGDDVFVLRTLADQVAVAVMSARAYTAQQEQAWVTTVMLQVAEATGQADGMNEVLEAAVRVTAMLAGVDSCTIWLWNEEFERFDYAADYGLRKVEDAPAAALRFTPGQWAALDCMRTDKTACVLQRGTDELPPAFEAVIPGDTIVLLPMLNKAQVFGVMGVSLQRDHNPELSERRQAMLGGIAHQVAAAVDNSRLSAAQQEEAWVSTVLLQVAEAVGRFQPIDDTLDQVAHLAPLLAGVDRCAILLQDADGNFHARKVYAAREELASAYEEAVIQPGDLPLLDDACRLGQPLEIDDVCGSELIPDAWRERFGSCSVLVVPLLLADVVIGAIVADDLDAAHTYNPRRVRILSGIASQTAIAIENTRLQAMQAEQVRLTRELELARQIQRSLVPQSAPDVPDYQIVYSWRPAGEVGGDFFDFMQLAENRLGLLVADVSDKGIPAALYMVFARTLFRAAAFSGRVPAATLARANELLVSDSTSEMFVTVYYAELDHAQHTLIYASGGHNLAYYVPATGDEPQPMITEGIALGILTPIRVEQKSIRLAPGDLVVFYTDGVTDMLNDEGEAFGEERLSALLAAHHHECAAEIADTIENALQEFAGGAGQYDDVTLVLLKRDNDTAC
jgi:sigma-B regulation protein RsbU (phosphoserine phosphatase)